MGNLSNLYISQSYISLLHFGSDSSASATLTDIQDGLGYSTGISMNNKGDLAVGGALTIGGGLTLSGSVKINTIYTSSTPQYVNSGNQYTDNIIRITGSYASGSPTSPTLNEVQVGWPVYGAGLVSGAVVTDKTFIPATGWEFTINQNTAVWFGLYNFTNPTPAYVNFSVSGSEDITGSLWVRDGFSTNNISASGNISASNLWIKDTIHAYRLDVTIESSSIIFTSGSNIIGDEANVDTQTLVGRTIVTGSLEVTSSIKATSDISSSTLNGVGNVTLYSQSVDSRINTASSSLSLFSGSQYKTDSASFSTRIETNSSSFYNFSSSQYKPDSSSFDSRLDLVESTSSFLQNTFSASQYKNDSSSFDSRIDSLEAFSSSIVTNFATVAQLNLSSSQLQSNINTKLDTASFNSYTSSISSSNSLVSQSFVTTISNLSSSVATSFSASAASQTNLSSSVSSTIGLLSASIAAIDNSQSFSINAAFATASAYSASAAAIYATTGSNQFNGRQSISGSLEVSSSMVYSGSVRGQVFPITIVSSTASIDCSKGNFFTLNAPAGATRLEATNINPGETLSLRITNLTSASVFTTGSSLKFPNGFAFIPTNVSASTDIITFLSFDNTAIYSVAANYFI
jgi:hypothetical protein